MLGVIKRERSSVLYGWPLAVCENIKCVRARLPSKCGGDEAGRGVVTISLRGGSLMPMIMCAPSKFGRISAPACR